MVIKNNKAATKSETTIGVGSTPKILPPKKRVNSGGTPDTVREFATIMVKPRKIESVPMVIIKGCKPVLLTKKPLIKPIAAPKPMVPTKTAIQGLIPKDIILAVQTPVNAITEPTERSIPASKMAKNSPQPIKIVIELCSMILMKLLKDINAWG